MWWHRPPGDAVVEGWRGGWCTGRRATRASLQAIRRWDARLLAPEVRCPARVVAGASDQTFLPAESRGLAEALPHGSFERVEGPGTLPSSSRTEEVPARRRASCGVKGWRVLRER